MLEELYYYYTLTQNDSDIGSSSSGNIFSSSTIQSLTMTEAYIAKAASSELAIKKAWTG